MRRTLLLVLIVIIFMMTALAVETNVTNVTTVTTTANFSASSLTAQDVNCAKCHTNTPHIIHAPKPVTCENCHGDKLSVSIPQCTKCHNGPIHQVHTKGLGKGCANCHKDIEPIHTNLTNEAVCSHCHKDIIDVHGANQSCSKCHKTPPNIVRPLKLEGMVLVCQDCHPATSVATIHGDVNNKQGCYECHKGASNLTGSSIPHTIHSTKATCEQCHQENGKIVVPQCTRCHDIDTLHTFDKIGKLTTGLRCQICHPGEFSK